MSLRSKIVILLSAVVLLYAGLDHLIQQFVVFKSFVVLEEMHARDDLRRAILAIEAEVKHLSSSADTLAAWDDTYAFIAEPDERYVQSNLGAETFRERGIDLLYVCDTTGKVVWGRIRDPSSLGEIQLRDFPRGALSAQHPLIDEAARAQRDEGLLMTERGPMLVSARPILDSARAQPARGTLIVGRFLTDGVVDGLVKRTGVDFNLWPLTADNLPAEDSAVLDEVTARGPMTDSTHDAVVRDDDVHTLHAYTTYADMRAAPALVLRANVARNITERGHIAVRYALLSTIAAGLLILLVMLSLLQRTVLTPIAALTAHALTIGRTEDFSKKLNLARDDEVGILSREFDSMMQKLSDSRAALVNAARAAGMSEIATGVLHNVGNVLNSVNVSATLLAEKTRSSSVADLKQMMQVVRDSAQDLATFVANDPRGKHLEPLLASLTAQIASEHENMQSEVKSLTEGIEHIKELVQAQQCYAGRSGVLESVRPADLIEKALAMTAPPTAGAAPIEIVREYEDVAPCALDRHRVMEILVNVLQNARQAMQGAEGSMHKLVLRLKRAEGERLHIEIQDNGVGIPEENMARIFTHGFTTKKTGHGFGLHSSANAATEIGGSLYAHSDGLGSGATFTLELPIKNAQAAVLSGAAA